jgi:hypothetical protein
LSNDWGEAQVQDFGSDRIQAEKLLTTRIDLLKLELTNLTTKIISSVDFLWKIRAAAAVIWIGTLGYSIDKGASGTRPIFVMLVVTMLIPIWFCWIDSKYNRWYQRLNQRETQIQLFINSKEYVLPSTGQKMSFDDLNKGESSLFPVYDISGKFTFCENPRYKWEASLIRSWTDQTPALVYGSQMFVSAILVTVYETRWWSYLFVPGVVLFYLVLFVSAYVVKKRMGV